MDVWMPGTDRIAAAAKITADIPAVKVLIFTTFDRDEYVFAGRSNREIAAALHLSEGTVKVHVGRILAKLDVRDRIQAVILAYESGLITPGS